MAKFDIDQLATQFDKIKLTIAAPDILQGLDKVQREFASLNTGVVGKVFGEINNGIKSLSKLDTDFPLGDASSKKIINLKNNTTIPQNMQNELDGLQNSLSELDESLPGISVKIKPILSGSEKTIASAITGSSVAEAFNGIVLTLPTGSAIAESVAVLSSEINSGEVKNVIEQSLGQAYPQLKAELPEISNFLSPNLNLSINANLNKLTDKLKLNLSDELSVVTDFPALDALHELNNSARQVVSDLGLTKSPFSTNIANSVLKSFAEDDFDTALKNVSVNVSFPGLEEKLLELQSGLGKISSLLSMTSIANSPDGSSPIISTNPIRTVSGISKNFSIVNSSQELQAEFINLKRDINTAIFHWSESYSDQDIGAKDIQASAGSVEYHYIIRKNGSVQRGKPISEVANHAGSYDTGSLSILLVGGYKGISGEVSELSEESINLNQKNSLIRIISLMYDVWPGILMYGHGEIDESVSRLEPGVDISALIENKFNRSNSKQATIQKDPNNKSIGLPTGIGNVKYAFHPNTTRDDYIQPQLMTILENTTAALGFRIEITSGGQLPNDPRNVPGGRTGSNRHNYGWAADCRVFNAQGQRLNFGTDGTPNADCIRFCRYLVSQGVTGLGAGPGYMGGNLHVDISFGRSIFIPNDVEPGAPGIARYWSGGPVQAWLGTVMPGDRWFR